MPTYEYECTRCGRLFDLFQSITEKPRRTISCDCKQCKNKAPVVRRISGGAGLIFKGSGFYITDYRSENYKKAAKAESDGKAEKSEKPAAESKPAAASEPAKSPKEPKKSEPRTKSGSKSSRKSAGD